MAPRVRKTFAHHFAEVIFLRIQGALQAGQAVIIYPSTSTPGQYVAYPREHLFLSMCAAYHQVTASL